MRTWLKLMNIIERVFRRFFKRIACCEESGTRFYEKYNSQITQRQLSLHYQFIRDQGMVLPSFEDTGFRVYSQNDEDGLLHYIFSLIGTTNKLCLDVAYAGPHGANTTNLLCNFGWHGLLIEGDRQGVENSRRFFASHDDTKIFLPQIVCSWVTAENINELCRQHDLTGEIDLFSLDMDGVDYWVWKALDAVAPRVVVVEYLDILGPDRAVTVPYQADFVASRPENALIGEPYDYFGASLPAFVKLGKEKGYRLVGVNKYGFNAFFVREGIGEEWLPEVAAHTCFSHPKVRKGIKTRYPKVKNMEWVDV